MSEVLCRRQNLQLRQSRAATLFHHKVVEYQPSTRASRTSNRGEPRQARLEYLDLYLIHASFTFQPEEEQDPRDQYDGVYDNVRFEFLQKVSRSQYLLIRPNNRHQLVPAFARNQVLPAQGPQLHMSSPELMR
jgi:hypothetical protein